MIIFLFADIAHTIILFFAILTGIEARLELITASNLDRRINLLQKHLLAIFAASTFIKGIFYINYIPDGKSGISLTMLMYFVFLFYVFSILPSLNKRKEK